MSAEKEREDGKRKVEEEKAQGSAGVTVQKKREKRKRETKSVSLDRRREVRAFYASAESGSERAE